MWGERGTDGTVHACPLFFVGVSPFTDMLTREAVGDLLASKLDKQKCAHKKEPCNPLNNTTYSCQRWNSLYLSFRRSKLSHKHPKIRYHQPNMVPRPSFTHWKVQHPSPFFSPYQKHTHTVTVQLVHGPSSIPNSSYSVAFAHHHLIIIAILFKV